MPDPLDMSLDEIIRYKKKFSGARGNSRRKASGSGPGPARRSGNRELLRTTPYSVPPPFPVLQPSMKQEMLSGGSTMKTGTKLYISNLDYGVSNDDIQVLFSEVGQLKGYSVHYDKSGRSKGTAEVVFLHKTDALAAIKRYDNIRLDGKPLKIDFVGANMLIPAVVQPTTNGMTGKAKDFFQSVGDLGAAKKRVLTSNTKSGLGVGGGRGGGQSKNLSAKDLDADLEKYHMEARKIN